jgi:hypothetical protein
MLSVREAVRSIIKVAHLPLAHSPKDREAFAQCAEACTHDLEAFTRDAESFSQEAFWTLSVDFDECARPSLVDCGWRGKACNQREMFEENQEKLEVLVEDLSKFLERDMVEAADVTPLQQKLLDIALLCRVRNNTLLDHVYVTATLWLVELRIAILLVSAPSCVSTFLCQHHLE